MYSVNTNEKKAVLISDGDLRIRKINSGWKRSHHDKVVNSSRIQKS